MYWVILETKGGEHMRIACEASMQLAQKWIRMVLPGCTDPVRIEMWDSATGEGVLIEIDEREMRVEKTQRAMGARFMASRPAVARREGSGAPQPPGAGQLRSS